MYYKIGEVAEALQVRTSVLRFWESEFSFLKPEKSTTGQRLYSKNEVELILQVKRLLYDEKFTIEGVKKRISPKGKLINPEYLSQRSGAEGLSQLLQEVRRELEDLRRQL
ncbi:MAG: MerR family transcriptional regulator [Desulfuromonadales bacterium]